MAIGFIPSPQRSYGETHLGPRDPDAEQLPDSRQLVALMSMVVAFFEADRCIYCGCHWLEHDIAIVEHRGHGDPLGSWRGDSIYCKRCADSRDTLQVVCWIRGGSDVLQAG